MLYMITEKAAWYNPIKILNYIDNSIDTYFDNYVDPYITLMFNTIKYYSRFDK